MKEEELLKKRLMELCEKAYNQNIYTYTHFLNEYEQSIYQDMKQELAYAHPILVGGHKYFTRAVVMFGSEELFVIRVRFQWFVPGSHLFLINSQKN